MYSIQSERNWISPVMVAPGKSQGWELSDTSLPASRQCKQGILQSNWKGGKNLTKGKTQIDGGTKKQKLIRNGNSLTEDEGT